MMTKRIDRNRNTTDEANILPGVELNVNTSVLIFPANPLRLGVRINNNDSNAGAFIKMQPTSQDNDIKGDYLARKGAGEPFSIDGDNPYTGEICGIAESGTPTVYGVEW